MSKPRKLISTRPYLESKIGLLLKAVLYSICISTALYILYVNIVPSECTGFGCLGIGILFFVQVPIIAAILTIPIYYAVKKSAQINNLLGVITIVSLLYIALQSINLKELLFVLKHLW
jgi:hypothetical protein